MSADNGVYIYTVSMIYKGKIRKIYIVKYLQGENYFTVELIQKYLEGSTYTTDINIARIVANKIINAIYNTEYGIIEDDTFSDVIISTKRKSNFDMDMIARLPAFNPSEFYVRVDNTYLWKLENKMKITPYECSLHRKAKQADKIYMDIINLYR
jgi:hypothetical protein